MSLSAREMYIYYITKETENMKNARIARNENIAPCRKRKKLRRVKGQEGGPKLKIFPDNSEIRENDGF
ncbi:hypothetical protein COE39_02880 [Bacillus thuringiensis]|nr:hypothetical protein COE39_02880 [Bacillus thuringiensis]